MFKIHPRRVLLLGCLSACALASAAPAITKFPIPGGRIPLALAIGPDGAIWGGADRGAVIRVSDDGAISTFPLPDPKSDADAITTGPDGNLWFTVAASGSARAIARLEPSGRIDAFPLSADSRLLLGIAAGPDGNLWFTDDRTVQKDFHGDIGRITTAGEITEQPVPSSAGAPLTLTAGPDGALWFTAFSTNGNAIVRVTTDFRYTVFPLSLGNLDALAIAAGADGNLWFTAIDSNTKEGKIGRMTPQGTTTLFSIPAASPLPQAISAGPCLDLWFTAAAGIGRVTLDGKVTIFPFSDLQNSKALGVAPDARRNVWFADPSAAAMARVELLGCRALAKVSKETARKPAKARKRL